MVRVPRIRDRVLKPPPESLRKGPFRAGAFTSRLHEERTASILGIALGVAFTICFLTGLMSHLIQHPPSWFTWPSRPAGLYRVTQGLHVATGIASIPLLLGKLWAVYPKLWQWPPIENVLHAVERLTLVPLVAGSLFLLFTGIANIGLWYPWRFFFPTGHYWAAWITIGALIVHIGAKGAIASAALRKDPAGSTPSDGTGLDRRGFLATIFGTAGVLTLTTAGQTFSPLARFAVLAPRRQNVGVQGFPVNKSAASAGVERIALDPSHRLTISGNVARPLSLSLAELAALPQHDAILPIACVEGWSAEARWTGVRVSDLLTMAGAQPGAAVTVGSLQERGLYRRSELNHLHAGDPDTLLALRINGEPLDIDHGYPVRLIGPNRPGVMQTKWVSTLVVE